MRKEDKGVYLVNGNRIVSSEEKHLLTGIGFTEAELKTANEGTMAWSILKAHNTSSDMENLRLKFDALVSHDMTYMNFRFPLSLQTVITACVRLEEL